MHIASTFFKENYSRSILRGKPNVTNSKTSFQNTVLDEIRYDGIGHILNKRAKQRRCKMKECSGKPRTFCQKCDVTLCISCFPKFHKKCDTIF